MWPDGASRVPLVDGVAYHLRWPRHLFGMRVAAGLLAPASGTTAAYLWAAGADLGSAVMVGLPALSLCGVAVVVSVLLRRASEMPVEVAVRSDGLRIDGVRLPYPSVESVDRADGMLRVVAGGVRYRLVLPEDSDAYDVIRAAWAASRARSELRPDERAALERLRAVGVGLP